MSGNDYVSEERLKKLAERRGYVTVEVLHELKGKPFDDVALGFIVGLRPSCVRVVRDWQTDDSRLWRVTVFVGPIPTIEDLRNHVVSESNLIRKIEQEIEVALPEGVQHGHALKDALRHGFDSPQVKRHVGAEGYFYGVDGVMRTSRSLTAGSRRCDRVRSRS